MMVENNTFLTTHIVFDTQASLLRTLANSSSALATTGFLNLEYAQS